jgi:diguanylate cyclase (GGDEF)-like protein
LRGWRSNVWVNCSINGLTVKLRTKILFLLVPLIVMSLLVLGWFAYIELRETSEQRVFGEMRASLDHLRAHMKTEVETARGNIELLANQTMVKKYILTNDETERFTLFQPPLLRLFSDYQKAFPEYYEIRLFLPDGYEDARQTQPYIENLTEEEGSSTLFHAMQSAGDQVYATVYRNPDNQRISLFIGKPLILIDRAVDPIGIVPSLRGYISLTIDMSEIESYIREGTISNSGYLFATNKTGNVIFESSKRPLHDVVSTALTNSALSSEELSFPLMISLDGEKVFLMGSPLSPDLNVFAVLPENELRTISYKLGLVVAAITLVTILVMTLFMMITMEYQIIRPIHRLRSFASELGRGNWAIEVSGVNTSDEIGELTTAFKEMACNLQQSDERVRFLAYHDSLTGLPNRAMFKEYVDRSIAHAKRNQQLLAILFLDVDNFKKVNDTLGHHAGDLLLQEVSDRLTKILRGDDYVTRGRTQDDADKILARVGGDEFIILLSDIHNPHAAGPVAQRLVDTLAKPIYVSGQKCHVSASIGMTIYPIDGRDTNELIKNADIAMYHAKAMGKNNYQYFANSMNVETIERLELEGRLRNALEQDHLELYYQPQVHSVTREIVGLEALLRWRDPEHGLILPNDFIAVAETSGLILPIGEWVLHQACRQARTWQEAGLTLPGISVNISSIQFARQDVPAIVQEALTKSQLDPRCLELEITESAIMSDPENTVKMLNAIKVLGVNIALDDFGTSYSSLSNLRRFPIDTLKIDRSFIHEIDEKPADAELIAAIAAMAHTLGLRVIVEGIEKESHLGVVVERQCDVIQGFLFSRPLPANEIAQLLGKSQLIIA